MLNASKHNPLLLCNPSAPVHHPILLSPGYFTFASLTFLSDAVHIFPASIALDIFQVLCLDFQRLYFSVKMIAAIDACQGRFCFWNTKRGEGFKEISK